MKRPFYHRPQTTGKNETPDGEGPEKPLSILDDGVFKAMFTADSEDSRVAMRSLLSACTHREIIDFQVINNDLNPAHMDAKQSRLDIHVTFNDGEAANLEMQVEKTTDDLRKRAEVYAALLLSGQTAKGSRYKEVKRVFQIFFLNCTLYPKSNKLPRRYSYREEKEHDRLSDTTEIIFYELPKLKKRVREILKGKVKQEALSEEEKWCIYMRYRHEKQASDLINDLCQKEEGIMFAEKAAAKVSRNYRRYVRKMTEIKNSMDQASRDYDRGIAEGIAEGKTAGVTEASLEIARKMKAMGDSTEKIQAVTGLSAEAVSAL